MSELFDKQVNAQKEKLLGFMQAPASPREKHVMEMKESIIRKNDMRIKYVFDGRGEIIRCLWKGRVMDINKLQVNDS